MKRGKIVRLEKIATINEGSYGVGYWLEGMLQKDVELGEIILIDRYRRAGRCDGEPEIVNITGVCFTSPVKGISADGTVETENSIYKLTEL